MGHLEAIPGTSSRHSYSREEEARIREQVARICKNPLFSQSKRYPAFLSYIVEQTLQGHIEELKERTIGVEVFHRSSDYDSNSDPTVRIAAGEVRKRLAQYYYEPGHEQELRIELPVGSYVPVFRMPGELHAADAPSSEPVQPAKSLAPWKLRPVWFGVVIGASAILLILTSYLRQQGKPLGQGIASAVATAEARSAKFDRFWNQVVEANGSVQVCLGGWKEHEPTGPGTAVTLSSYKSIGRLTDLLESRKKRYLNTLHVVGPDYTDLSGFLDGPVVYVGYYKPIAPLMESWRYSFQKEAATRTVWIRDRDAVFDRQWRTEIVPPQQRSESYAIVARLLDPQLKRPMIIVAGIHSFGTVGGVEVLTNPTYMDVLLRDAPPEWHTMNFQAVVETRMQNDAPGPPKILATHFWK
jgi:hypothetical protein